MEGDGMCIITTIRGIIILVLFFSFAWLSSETVGVFLYPIDTLNKANRRDNIMFELDQLIRQIEELRSSTIKVQEDKYYTDPEVVAACHELHAALDRYQGILMRIEN